MDAPQFPEDFSEFLRLLNAHRVEYLLVGGYAVGLHGYPRATIDLDIWVPSAPDNAQRLVSALRGFGFDVPTLNPGLFLAPESLVRFGIPPFRIGIMTSIDGVGYAACRVNAIIAHVGGVDVPVISLADLKTNKQAAGRHKDLADLEHLP